ncbi:hypothetical protein EVAR_55329_1 [Eumeta japonica]|uniref:Uncharacterized protein n=1 Tax=Eumeta variegata TaxID=151549 RepID=A0A4C1ZDF4_EUMVA|nr:hypothetical protein EVAR_55329_1 [Eumeta japonica]
MGLRRLITEFHGHLPAPSSDSGYHIAPKYSVRRIKRAQTRWGVVYYGVSMATFQLHHQTLLPYSTKVLGKTNQTSPNSMGLPLMEFLWPPSSSIIRSALCHNIALSCDLYMHANFI